MNGGFCNEDFIELVDHKAIFSDFDHVLPTFNSLSIETALWRIPGLANKFIYLNDDFFLNRPTYEHDWFLASKPRLRSSLYEQQSDHLERKRKKLKYRITSKLYNKKPSYPEFYLNQEYGAQLAGCRDMFWRFAHVPYPATKETFKKYYTDNKDIFQKNISHRFRDARQHHPFALANHIEVLENQVTPEPDSTLLYIDFSRHEMTRIREMHLELGTYRTACIQNLDMIGPECLKRLATVLGVKFKHILPTDIIDEVLKNGIPNA